MLVAAHAGAGWAFQRLWQTYAGAVTGYLRLQGAAEPEDLTSEVFLGAFRSIRGFNGGESAFRSWLFTIAHRRLLDSRRAQVHSVDRVVFDTSTVGGLRQRCFVAVTT